MVTVPLGLFAFKRQYAQLPEIELLNRFVEAAPTNQIEQVTLISRPGSSLVLNVGLGPIEGFATEPGALNGDLFIFSGTQVFRYDGSTVTTIAGQIAAPEAVEWAVVTGDGFEHLFIADGTQLLLYEGEGFARATLTGTSIASGDEVEIGGVHYRWTSGDVNAGSPDGSAASPWLVAVGAAMLDSLKNLKEAINAGAGIGVAFSSGITAHPDVESVDAFDSNLIVKAKNRGIVGNNITVSVVTGANISWNGATLSGGGDHVLLGIATPDDVGIVSVTTIASHIIAVAAQSQRFYWILPGEQRIDPLNFAEAESFPDEIISVRTVGDQFWLFGERSTEVWTPTGDPSVPFQPIRGRAFTRGVLPGSVVRLGNRVVVVGDDGVVYSVEAGARRISHHGIEERIRQFKDQGA